MAGERCANMTKLQRLHDTSSSHSGLAIFKECLQPHQPSWQKHVPAPPALVKMSKAVAFWAPGFLRSLKLPSQLLNLLLKSAHLRRNHLTMTKVWNIFFSNTSLAKSCFSLSFICRISDCIFTFEKQFLWVICEGMVNMCWLFVLNWFLFQIVHYAWAADFEW